MDKQSARKALIEQRLNLPDRLQRADLLQRVLRIWLVGRADTVIGAYWPIKGEFDPLPALYRWQEDALLAPSLGGWPVTADAQLATDSLAQRLPRKIGLPVVNKTTRTRLVCARSRPVLGGRGQETHGIRRTRRRSFTREGWT